MPKDPKRNRSNYDIGGGSINEFEFHKNQEAMAEEMRARFDQLNAGRGEGEDAQPQSEAERIFQMMEAAREKVARKKGKQSSGGGQTLKAGQMLGADGMPLPSTSGRMGASTARKKQGGAKKGGAKKASARKGSAGKSAAKKSGGKQSGAKKGSTKKSAARKSAKGAARKTARQR
jgi:hypothetical protein